MIFLEFVVIKLRHFFSIIKLKIFSKKWSFINKIFRIELIIFIVISSNIIWIYLNQKSPYYYYSYEKDINLIYLYLLHNAQEGSIIWRPPLEKPDIDFLLYNSKIYSYNLLNFNNFTSLERFLLTLQNNKTKYFIYKNPEIFDTFPQGWQDKSLIHANITIKKINFLDYRTNLVKIIDKADPSSYAVFRDNSLLHRYHFGSFEWWLFREKADGNEFHFYFRDESYRPTINISISDFNKIQYWNGSSNIICSNFTDNRWHHFRIDFEHTKSNYQNLGKNKFNIYFDNIKIAANISMIYSDSQKIGWFEFNTINATNLTIYIDSFTHYDDLNYKLGENIFYNYYIPENISKLDLVLNYSFFKLFRFK
ncbi:MAG: hypothetical protein ACTSRP_09285 [Candidatus Helarchaeota archaeon]